MAIRSLASGFLIRMIKKDGAFYVMNIHPSSSIFILPSRSRECWSPSQLPQSRSLSTPWTVLTGTSVTVTSMLFQSVDGEITFTAQHHSGWRVFLSYFIFISRNSPTSKSSSVILSKLQAFQGCSQ